MLSSLNVIWDFVETLADSDNSKKCVAILNQLKLNSKILHWPQIVILVGNAQPPVYDCLQNGYALQAQRGRS